MYKQFSSIICYGTLLLSGFAAAQPAEHVVRSLREVSAHQHARAISKRTVDDTCIFNAIKGILQAPCFADLVAKIPCGIVGTLSGSLGAALDFAAQAQAGVKFGASAGADIGVGVGAGASAHLPGLLLDANVPLEVCNPLLEVVGITLGLPNSILGEIGLSVDGMVDFFGKCEAGVDISGLINGILGGILGGGLNLDGSVSASLDHATLGLGGIFATISAEFGGAANAGAGVGLTAGAACAKTGYPASPEATADAGATETIGGGLDGGVKGTIGAGGSLGAGATATGSVGGGLDGGLDGGVRGSIGAGGSLAAGATGDAGMTAAPPSQSAGAGESAAPPTYGSEVDGIANSAANPSGSASSAPSYPSGAASGAPSSLADGIVGSSSATGYPGASGSLADVLSGTATASGTVAYGTGILTATGGATASPCYGNGTSCLPSASGYSGVPATGGASAVHVGYGMHAFIVSAVLGVFGGMLVL